MLGESGKASERKGTEGWVGIRGVANWRQSFPGGWWGGGACARGWSHYGLSGCLVWSDKGVMGGETGAADGPSPVPCPPPPGK